MDSSYNSVEPNSRTNHIQISDFNRNIQHMHIQNTGVWMYCARLHIDAKHHWLCVLHIQALKDEGKGFQYINPNFGLFLTQKIVWL